MALKLHTTYPGRFDSPSENYPQGKWRNRSNSTAHDGGYLEEQHMNDIYGFFGALLRNAEMSPNGEVDTAKKSQFYDALVEVAKKAVGEEGYRKLDDNVFNGLMTIKSDNDEQGVGILLQESDGTVRGQVVVTDQGLQLTQYPEGGGSQTFTFPDDGGELVVKDTSEEYFVDSRDYGSLEVALDKARELGVPLHVYGEHILDTTLDISNVKVVNKEGVVYDYSKSTVKECLKSVGVEESQVDVTAVTGDTLTTKTPLTTAVGDVLLLISETECDDPTDKDYCLGSRTANARPVYFGEVVTVSSVQDNTITLKSNLTFPRYSKEVNGRVATLTKISWANTNFTGSCTLKLSESTKQVGILTKYSLDPIIKGLNVSATYKASNALRIERSYRYTVEGVCKRPVDWVLEEDHSQYNSWLFVSCFGGHADLIECNGSQSFDETYSGVCSTFNNISCVSYNPKEQGGTSHGMSYGSSFNVEVRGNVTSGFSNRARFSTINLISTGVGRGVENCYGLSLNDWGMSDVVADVNVSNCYAAVRIERSFRAVAHTASVIANTRLSGVAHNCNSVYLLGHKTTALSEDSNISLELNSNKCENITRVRSSEGGWHGVKVSGDHLLDDVDASLAAIDLGDNSKYTYLGMLRAYSKSGSRYLFNNTTHGWHWSPETCIAIGFEPRLFQGTRKDYGASSFSALFEELFKDRLPNSNLIRIRDTSPESASYEFSLDTPYPKFREITFVSDINPLVFTSDGTVTLLGDVSPAKVKSITRISGSVYLLK